MKRHSPKHRADLRAYRTFTTIEGVRRSRADLSRAEVESRYGAIIVGMTPSDQFVPPVFHLDGPPEMPAGDDPRAGDEIPSMYSTPSLLCRLGFHRSNYSGNAYTFAPQRIRCERCHTPWH